MASFTVKASVTVDVEMEIEADTAENAKSIFNKSIMMTASLSDTPADKFTVIDDSITELYRLEVEDA